MRQLTKFPEIIGIPEKLHKPFQLTHPEYTSTTRKVYIIPKYESYDWPEWLFSGLIAFSASIYALFSIDAINTFQDALIDENYLPNKMTGPLTCLAKSSSAVDAFFIWLTMANIPQVVKELKEAPVKAMEQWSKRKEICPRVAIILYTVASFGCYAFGSLIPIIGIANRVPNAKLWILLAGSFAGLGKFFIYIYTNIPALTPLLEIGFGQIENDPKKDYRKIWKKLPFYKKSLIIVLIVPNFLNQLFTFRGGFKWFRTDILEYYFNSNPSELVILDWSAGIFAAIQSLVSGVKNLEIAAGKHGETLFPFGNKLLGCLYKSLFGVCLALVWYSRSMSGPEQVLQGKHANEYTPSISFLSLVMSALYGTQYVCWIYPKARRGIHYLLNQYYFYRGTAYTECILGYSNLEYIDLTEAEIKDLEEKAKLLEMVEQDEEQQDVPQVENHGYFDWVRQWPPCGKKAAPGMDEEKSGSIQSSEAEAEAASKCSFIWAAITTCCGLLNCFRNKGSHSTENLENNDVKIGANGNLMFPLLKASEEKYPLHIKRSKVSAMLTSSGIRNAPLITEMLITLTDKSQKHLSDTEYEKIVDWLSELTKKVSKLEEFQGTDSIATREMRVICKYSNLEIYYDSLRINLYQLFMSAIVISSGNVEIDTGFSALATKGLGMAITQGAIQIGVTVTKGIPLASILGAIIESMSSFAIERNIKIDLETLSNVAQVRGSTPELLAQELARKITFGRQEIIRGDPSKFEQSHSGFRKEFVIAVKEKIAGRKLNPIERLAGDTVVDLMAFAVSGEFKKSKTRRAVIDKALQLLDIRKNNSNMVEETKRDTSRSTESDSSNEIKRVKKELREVKRELKKVKSQVQDLSNRTGDISNHVGFDPALQKRLLEEYKENTQSVFLKDEAKEYGRLSSESDEVDEQKNQLLQKKALSSLLLSKASSYSSSFIAPPSPKRKVDLLPVSSTSSSSSSALQSSYSS